MKYLYRFLIVGAMISVMAAIACSSDDGAAAPAAPAQTQAAPAAPAPATQVPVAPAAAPKAAATAKPAVAPTYAPSRPVAAAAGSDADTGAQFGGTLNWTPSATIANLDPIRNTAFVTRSVTHQFHDYMFGWTWSGSSAPQMVDTWSMKDDATEYTFKLRDGLKFHDGSSVKSSDITGSIMRWKTGIGGPSRVWGLAGEPILDAPDDSTVVIKPQTPFGLWVNYWGFFATPIIKGATARSLAFEDVNTDYNATGPYKFHEWIPGARISLVNNDLYSPRDEPKDGSAGGRIPYLDRIDYIEVPDAATRVAALQTGQTDLVTGVPHDFYDSLMAESKINVSILKPFAKQMVATNKTQKPLNNPKARLALQAATDVKAHMAASFGQDDLYMLCPAIFFCGSQWASESGADLYWEVDIAKGKKLWAEAMAEENYTGKMIVLANTDIPYLYNRALILKEDLENIGAEVEFAVSDWATLISRKIANLRVDPQEDPSKGWHFYQTGDEGAIDPVSDAATGTSWNGGWGNEEGYALAEKWTKATSYEEAKGYVDELQRIYYEEDPSLIVYGYSSWLTAQSVEVRDWRPHSIITIDGTWLSR